jgi:GNAT superfamily N-acetyltransferase
MLLLQICAVLFVCVVLVCVLQKTRCATPHFPIGTVREARVNNPHLRRRVNRNAVFAPVPAAFVPQAIAFDAACVSMTQSDHFAADIGFLSNYAYADERAGVFIRPFADVPPDVQREACESNYQQWKDKLTDTHSAAEFMAYVEKNWTRGDVFYVVLSCGGRFIGTAALDRLKFNPFVSHLFITPAYRKRHIATLALDFLQHTAAHMGFKELRLWCEPELEPFYKRLGWQYEADNNGVKVMKRLQHHAKK